jgi:hypothetical protein
MASNNQIMYMNSCTVINLSCFWVSIFITIRTNDDMANTSGYLAICMRCIWPRFELTFWIGDVPASSRENFVSGKLFRSVFAVYILKKSGLLNARSLRHRVQSKRPDRVPGARSEGAQWKQSGSPKKDCKTVCIFVHRHYILNVLRKRDKFLLFYCSNF